MIDWVLASRVAEVIAGSPAPGGPLPGDLDALARRSADLVVDYTRLKPATRLPAPESIDRQAWIQANLATLRSTLGPSVERLGGGFGPLAGPARTAAGALLGGEIGVVVGYLGQRVLGQYELSLMSADTPPRLLFVAPNIRQAARQLDASEEEMLAWIAFHEVTHAVQFGAVGWLRDHIAGLLRELLGSLELRLDNGILARLPRLEDVRAFVQAMRRQGFVVAVTGPERAALLDRLQAVMAMVEGHAEHVMDAVGVHELPSLERLRARLDSRRRDRPPLVRLLEWLLGLELKLRQYDLGRRFCDAVVAADGIDGLNRAWLAPELLPSTAELEDPRAWLARTRLAA